MKNNTIKKLMTLAAAGAISTLAFGTVTMAADKTIAFVLPYESDLFASIIEGCRPIFAEAGYDTTENYYEGDLAKHIEIVENLITTGVSAICVNPVGGGVDDVYQQALDAGITVYAFGTEMENYTAMYASDEVAIGSAMGQAAADYVNNVMKQESGEAAAFTDDATEVSLTRSKYMTETFLEACPGWTIVAEDTPSEAGDATTITENMLQAHPDIQVLLGYGDMFSVEATNVFEASGRTDEKYCIVSTDGQPDALQLIAGNHVLRSTLVYDDVIGSIASGMLGAIDGTVTGTNAGAFTTVTIDNVADFLEEEE